MKELLGGEAVGLEGWFEKKLCMSLEAAFSKGYEYFVELHQDDIGEVGRAKLAFGDGAWPRLEFDGSLSPKGLVNGRIYRRIIAKSATGEIFTLFDCEVRDFYAHVDFVVEGEVGENFKGIGVRYSDVSEWFLARQYLQGMVGETLAWTNKPESITVDIKTPDEHFLLSTDVIGSYERSGEDHLINEHVRFTFERLDGFFGTGDVRTKCLDLSSFISVLIAHPVSIIGVGLISEEHGFCHAYFPAFKRSPRDFKNGFWARCLMQKSMLDGRWQATFENYYKSEYRKVAWARLAGMQRYDSFWEYKAFGYISLLDGVVKKMFRGQRADVLPPAQSNMEALKARIEALQDPLSESQRDELLGIINDVFSSNDRSFSRRYRYAESQSDGRVIKIIDISPGDFSFIKKVRDAIAHGDEIDLAQDGLERVSIIVNKVILLLTYWAYLDFGLTDDDFINCLYGTHNPLALNPGIDRVYLERILEKADFYTVSEKRFEEISAIQGARNLSCFVRDSGGQIEYSEKYSRMLRDWMRWNKGGMMKPDEMFGVKNSHVKCSGTAYMECGDRRLSLYHIYVIDDESRSPGPGSL